MSHVAFIEIMKKKMQVFSITEVMVTSYHHMLLLTYSNLTANAGRSILSTQGGETVRSDSGWSCTASDNAAGVRRFSITV